MEKGVYTQAHCTKAESPLQTPIGKLGLNHLPARQSGCRLGLPFGGRALPERLRLSQSPLPAPFAKTSFTARDAKRIVITKTQIFWNELEPRRLQY